MRKLFSILGLVFSCVLAQAAAVNWTNYVPNIQVATNANVANQLQLGTTFTDGHLWPNAPDGTTPWYLEHTVPHTGGNLFQLVDPIGGPYFAITWLWEIQGADLLLTGSAQVQGTVRANNIVATNGIYTGGMTNTGVTVHTPSAVQTLAAGTVIAWDSSTERVVSTGGSVTLTGTPTIQTNNVPDGALITIRGTSDANTVTLQDYRLLAGTCIAMEMGSVTLMNGSEIRFQWSAANQKWQQVAFSANSSQNHKFANLTVQTNATVGGTGGGSLVITNGAVATTPFIVKQASGGTTNMIEVNGGGTNWLVVNTKGQTILAPGTAAAPSLEFGGGIHTGLWRSGNNLYVSRLGSSVARFQVGLECSLASTISWNTAADLSGSTDLYLLRDDSNVLGIRNGTTAQGLRVYNTWANAGTDYERGTLNWTDTPNSFTIGTKMGGTGISRSLQFVEGGTNIFYLDGATGRLLWNTDSTYDIGGSGTGRPKSMQLGGSLLVGQNMGHLSKTILTSPSDGVETIWNYANTDFKRLQFGGTTASFPAIGRNLTGFSDVVADDTAPTWHLNSRQITIKATNYTLVGSAATCSTNTDVSKIFVNYGVTAMSTNTLPTCVAGHTFTFMVEDADGMMIVAAGGATIRIAATASAANGWISATAIGNTITLVGNSQATEWVALSHEGTWTFGP